MTRYPIPLFGISTLIGLTPLCAVASHAILRSGTRVHGRASVSRPRGLFTHDTCGARHRSRVSSHQLAARAVFPYSIREKTKVAGQLQWVSTKTNSLLIPVTLTLSVPVFPYSEFVLKKELDDDSLKKIGLVSAMSLLFCSYVLHVLETVDDHCVWTAISSAGQGRAGHFVCAELSRSRPRSGS